MRVTVGVSGGIAAYKAAELVRALQRQALEVHVVMTAAAVKFIQPLTFASLTGHKVISSLWEEWDSAEATAEQNGIEHIGEAQWTEALVVAPQRPTFWPSSPTALPTIFLPPCTWQHARLSW